MVKKIHFFFFEKNLLPVFPNFSVFKFFLISQNAHPSLLYLEIQQIVLDLKIFLRCYFFYTILKFVRTSNVVLNTNILKRYRKVIFSSTGLNNSRAKTVIQLFFFHHHYLLLLYFNCLLRIILHFCSPLLSILNFGLFWYRIQFVYK